MKKYLLAVPVCAALCAQAEDAPPASTVATTPSSANALSLKTDDNFWRDEIGNGFRKGAHEVGVSAGYAVGGKVFGTSVTHNLVLGDVHAGWILSDVVMENNCLRGNWEFLVDVFGGEQVNRQNAKLAAIDPVIRYDFATGSRLVPFFEVGAGVMYTDIRRPDLGSDFEFNEFGGVGLHWFFTKHFAVTLEGRYMHISNAGIDKPNRGVNTFPAMVGLNYFF